MDAGLRLRCDCTRWRLPRGSTLERVNGINARALAPAALRRLLALPVRSVAFAPPPSAATLTVHGAFAGTQVGKLHVALPVPVVDIACGGHHLLLRSAAGHVFACGRGECGRLGLGDTADRAVPTLISSLATSVVIGIACGREHSVVVCKDGAAFAFGWGEGGRLGLGIDADNVLRPTRVAAPDDVYLVGAGRESTLLVGRAGGIYLCGVQHLSSAAHDDTTRLCLVPTLMPWTGPSDHALVAAIKAGDAHYVLLTTTGDVYTWGYGGAGALAPGVVVTRNEPTRVAGLPKIIKVAAGPWHTVALGRAATWVWGDTGSRPCTVAAAVDVACSRTTTYFVDPARAVVAYPPCDGELLPPSTPLLGAGGDYVAWISRLDDAKHQR
ncbi:regulator of chromosome condensation rcc1 [Achlya hypogyna]|uniref:Regulator of chromosome condensation rcc1 n=1 Tax=Achlya hypogyna TaxID=1202772 RepID=A0A1V9Z6C7_ACHHY|nr:regulator of chromosome condensation rcc1 [Achlya hypogyna]